MAYKPVPTTQRVCVHCNTIYYAKDKRRMYCSSSCNTLAWMTRHGLSGPDQPEQAPKKATGRLDFTLHNVATIGTGVLAADATKAALNAVFDAQPTNAQVMEELKAVRLENAKLMGYISAKIDAVAGSVLDAKHGLAATGIEAQSAIVASERRRKKLPPGNSPAGR